MNAQEHWRALAEEKRQWAAYQASRGEYNLVTLRKAQRYDDAATALALGEQHGESYCVCHLRPMREMHLRTLQGRRA